MPKWKMEDRPDVTPAEVYEIGMRLGKITFSDPALATKLRASNLIIQFEFHDDER